MSSPKSILRFWILYLEKISNICFFAFESMRDGWSHLTTSLRSGPSSAVTVVQHYTNLFESTSFRQVRDMFFLWSV